MDSVATSGNGGDTFRRLEEAVGRALKRIQGLEAELQGARRRTAELDRLLLDVTGGDLPPSAMMERLRALEAENADLRRRLAGGREGVERLLAKIRFLEEQR